jgi:hypothetical protein
VTSLPDVPYYAIAFENANTIYVGSLTIHQFPVKAC